MTTKSRLFVSYRRTQLEAVRRAVELLEDVGVECFLDCKDIDPLSDLPETLRAAIDLSHALLIWWSRDYGESDICLQEFRRGWQHARRHSPNIERRIWIVNPEADTDHIFAGELDSKHFLSPPTAGSRWAEFLAKRLETLLPEGPLGDERQAVVEPVLHSVPIRSAEFTGRGRELMSIHSKLHPVRVGTSGATVVVQTHGMAGIGKTELATAYTRDFVMAYPGGVYWLNFAGWKPNNPASEHEAHHAWRSALEQALGVNTEPARRLMRDTQGAELPPVAVRERLVAQLGQQPDYLWVLDNVPELSPLDIRNRIFDFIRAPTARGHTLLTTRDARIADGLAHERLDVLALDDALRLLARFRPHDAHTELAAMRELVVEVGAHTQALILLGEHSRYSPGGYPRALERLRETGRLERIEQIAAQLQGLLGARACSIIASFALSIEPLSVTERELLSMASVCAPNLPIPSDVLAAGFGSRKEDDFSSALGGLVRASLVTRRGDSTHTIFIHPLVAEVAVRFLRVNEQALRQRLADILLKRLEQAGDDRPDAAIADEVDQARVLGACMEDERGVNLLVRAAKFEYIRGRYTGASIVGHRAVELACRVLGEEHPQTLGALSILAAVLYAHGDLSSARDLLEQVVALRRRLSGEEHPDTALALNNLASTLVAQGEFNEALRLRQRVFLILRQALGTDHPDTLTSMNNLANSLSERGEHDAARALLETVLPIRIRLLGETHPNTLNSIINVAHARDAQGDYAGARWLYEQVLPIERRVLGEEHPGTLTTMNNLAHTLSNLGDFNGARTLHDRVLAIRRRVLGEEHPDTLNSMNSLAHVLVEIGEFAQAQAIHQQSLLLHRRIFGEEHPNTLTSMSNLAAAQCASARSDLRSALATQEQVLSTRRRVLGDEHPDSVGSMCNLAHTLTALGDLGAARTLHEQVLSVRRRIFGDRHPETLAAMNDLALAMRRQGHLGNARDLYERVLAARRQVLGREHPDTCLSAWNLAQCLFAASSFAAGCVLVRRHLSWMLGREPATLSAIQNQIRDQISRMDGGTQDVHPDVAASEAIEPPIRFQL